MISFVLSTGPDPDSWRPSASICFEITRVLVHFAWQGIVVAAAFMAVNAALARASANTRYLAAVFALALVAICPLVTCLLLPVTNDFQTDSASKVSAGQLLTIQEMAPASQPPGQAVDGGISGSRIDRSMFEVDSAYPRWLRAISPIVAAMYLAGIVAMLTRLAVAFWASIRLQSAAKRINDQPIRQMVSRICERWSTSVIPVVAYCHRVSVPVIVGVIRPMILLPPALMAGMNCEQLEALLAHEIAHIRRWDLAINLFQRIVESFLFFHPATWYISHHLSVERENACDDLVLASGWHATDYVGALLVIAERCSKSKTRTLISASALAASGDRPSQLKLRILRMLGESSVPSSRLTHFSVLMPVLILLGTVSMAMTLSTHRETRTYLKSEEPLSIPRPSDPRPEDLTANPGSTTEASNSTSHVVSDESPSAVVIEGNSTIPTAEISKHIKIREGRPVTQKQIKDDVDALVRTRWFATVEPALRQTDDGIILVFRVLERPIVRRVEYKGLKKLKQKVFDSITQLKPGSPFDIAANRECARRIEEHYHEKGYIFATVELEKGNDREDREVVFLIHEGPKVKVTAVKFEGNKEFASEVLKTRTRTKTVIAWVIGGTFDPSTINDDVEGLKRYYHGLGYFDVEIVPEERFSSDKSKLEIHYHIDEGIRSKIRNVEIEGNNVLSEEEIRSMMKVQGGVFYNARDINVDVDKIKTRYGEQGRFFSRVDAIPRCTEEGGLIDLVYRIEEDKVYRIRKIGVHIENGEEKSL